MNTKELIPGTDNFIGQPMYFRSVHGDFGLGSIPAIIVGYTEHSSESPDFPKGIALQIQFDQSLNLATTWIRIDEVNSHPL